MVITIQTLHQLNYEQPNTTSKRKKTISKFKKRKYVKRSKIGNQDVQKLKKRRRIYLITGLRVEVLSP